MAERILSISGLRGILGDGLDPAYLTEYAAGLGTMTEGGVIVVARDGRMTGPMIQHAVVAGLMATGCRVIDAGIASTPTCGVLVDDLQAAGGLQITASHNPIEWNGLKPFSPEGSVFDRAQGERMLKILETGSFQYQPWDCLGSVETLHDAHESHLERVLRLIDVDSIRARRFNVVIDCNHGSGSLLGLRLLDLLGCDVAVLGETPDGRFEHSPEPIAENLTELCRTVKEQGADIGFAQDPDADRLAIVDNQGNYIGEELTLAFCADHVLARRRGPVVVNASTSRTTADLAAKHDCEFHRAHVGEANVVAKMKEVSAVLGGEGNGGIIEPLVGYVRDSFVGMAYVLEGLAIRNTTTAAWAKSLPRYSIVKKKIECSRDQIEAACRALQSTYGDAVAQSGDGLRLDWEDRWVQVRGSNTEPIVRVIAEAPETTVADALCEAAIAIVRKTVGREA